jgi:hypothetical protein
MCSRRSRHPRLDPFSAPSPPRALGLVGWLCGCVWTTLVIAQRVLRVSRWSTRWVRHLGVSVCEVVRHASCAHTGHQIGVVEVHARAALTSWSRSVGLFLWLRIAAAALSCSPVPSLCATPLRSHAISRTHICVASWGCICAALVGFRVQCAGCVRVVVSFVTMWFARCDDLSTLQPHLSVVNFLVTTCTYPDLGDSFPARCLAGSCEPSAGAIGSVRSLWVMVVSAVSLWTCRSAIWGS